MTVDGENPTVLTVGVRQDIDKGEIPPCSGEYNIVDDDGGWSRAVWAGVWEEWFGPKQPHLWTYKKPPVEWRC